MSNDTTAAPTAQTANLYAQRTYGALGRPDNPVIATVSLPGNNSFDVPTSLSWEGRVYMHEDIPSMGPSVIAYYQLHPQVVSAVPVTP